MTAGPLDEAGVRRLVIRSLGMSLTGFRPNGPVTFAVIDVWDGTAWAGTVHDETLRPLGGVAGTLASPRGGGPGPVRRLGGSATPMRVVPAALRRSATHAARPKASAAAAASAGPAAATTSTSWAIAGRRRRSAHTGFTGTSLALDPPTGLWAVLLTNAVHAGRDPAAVKALRRDVHAVVRTRTA